MWQLVQVRVECIHLGTQPLLEPEQSMRSAMSDDLTINTAAEKEIEVCLNLAENRFCEIPPRFRSIQSVRPRINNTS